MKRFPKHELPIIPTANLVDIAILLIIFYMACSHFISKTQGKVTPPTAPGLADTAEPMIVVTLDDKGLLYLQGLPVASVNEVENGVANLIRNKTTDEGRTVMLKCDATVGRTTYEPVLNAIVQAGGLILAAGDSPREQRRGEAHE